MSPVVAKWGKACHLLLPSWFVCLRVLTQNRKQWKGVLNGMWPVETSRLKCNEWSRKYANSSRVNAANVAFFKCNLWFISELWRLKDLQETVKQNNVFNWFEVKMSWHPSVPHARVEILSMCVAALLRCCVAVLLRCCVAALLHAPLTSLLTLHAVYFVSVGGTCRATGRRLWT